VIRIGCPKFFKYHPDANVFDYMKRFNIKSYDQAVKEIKSFGLGKETEAKILGYTLGNETDFVSPSPQNIFRPDVSNAMVKHTTHEGLRSGEYNHPIRNESIIETRSYKPKETEKKFGNVLNNYLSLVRKIFYVSKRLYKFVNRHYKDSLEEGTELEKTIDLLYQYVRKRLVYYPSISKEEDEEEEEFEEILKIAKEKKEITLEEIEKIFLEIKKLRKEIKANKIKFDREIDDLFEDKSPSEGIDDLEMALWDFKIPDFERIKT
jgi:hypothetical protein